MSSYFIQFELDWSWLFRLSCKGFKHWASHREETVLTNQQLKDSARSSSAGWAVILTITHPVKKTGEKTSQGHWTMKTPSNRTGLPEQGPVVSWGWQQRCSSAGGRARAEELPVWTLPGMSFRGFLKKKRFHPEGHLSLRMLHSMKSQGWPGLNARAQLGKGGKRMWGWGGR